MLSLSLPLAAPALATVPFATKNDKRIARWYAIRRKNDGKGWTEGRERTDRDDIGCAIGNECGNGSDGNVVDRNRIGDEILESRVG